MNTIPKLILQNPYRVLGVYASSPQRDIVSNISRAKAFLKVGKPVEFPFDLKGILPSLSRTVEMLDEAEAHLAIAKEKLLYTQFWFLKKTPLDDVAFNHLVAGNMDEAISIWGKQDNISSLQNRMVCHIINRDLRFALIVAEKLYTQYGDDYLPEVDSSSTLQLSSEEIGHMFIDSLGEEVTLLELLPIVSNQEWKNYISSQAIHPLINTISTEVERTKIVDHKNASSRKEAGEKLIDSTKDPLKQLKLLLNTTDPQYQMIVDKLGLEILQCGIDYFNNSEEDDAPHKAMKIQKYAQSIVVGPMAKQRCNENVKVLQKIIDNLPPNEVLADDKAIKKELEKYVKLPDKITYAVALMNNTKFHLLSIKQKLGKTNEYYLKISTQVVSNALHNVIGEVNDAQQPLVKLSQIMKGMDPTLSSILLSGDMDISKQYVVIKTKLKSTLREAWEATTQMDDFDMENSFRTRYIEQRITLKSLCDSMEVSTYVYGSRSTSRPFVSTTSRTASSSTVNKLKSSTDEKKEMNPIVAVLIIHVIWGLFGLSDGIGGFFGAMLVGITGWFIPINYLAYYLIEWIYDKVNE